MSRYPYGRLPRTHDPRDFAARPESTYSGEYVTIEAGFPPPWDQGQLGSCVAFGTCAAVAYAQERQGLAVVDPSQLFLYYAARARAGYPTSQDTGLEIRDGIASAAKDGVPPAVDWPYDVTRFAQQPPPGAYADARADEATVYGAVQPAQVDDVIASGFPLVIGFDVYDSFESDQTATTGVMSVPVKGEQLVGGHCVVLVSTPKDGSEIPGAVAGQLYRRARNSWSTDWGDGGWFWYPTAAMKYASDMWQITTISAPSPPSPSPTPQPGDAFTTWRLAADAFDGHRHVSHINREMAAANRAYIAAVSQS